MPLHQSDADFQALEEIVYGFTRRMHRAGDFFDSSSDEDDDDDDDDDFFDHRKPLSCPVCKRLHPYMAPPQVQQIPRENLIVLDHYSHDARVVYASFACPICLEDAAGPPMVVLACGHAVCQNDFRLLGGTTGNQEEDAQVRQAQREDLRQRRQEQQQRRQQQQQQDNGESRSGRRLDQQETDMEAAMRMIAASFGMLHSQNTFPATAAAEDHTTNDAFGFHHHHHQNHHNTDFDDFLVTNPPPWTTARYGSPVVVRGGARGNHPSLTTNGGGGTYGSTATRRNQPHRYRNNRNSYNNNHRTNNRYNYNNNNNNHHRNRNNRSPQPLFDDSDDDDDDDEGSYLDDSDFFEDTDDDDDSDEDDDDISEDEDDDDDDDDDSNDFDLEDVDAILWRLSQYHPGNMVDTDMLSVQHLPKTGQWMLVPEMASSTKVNLIYYCEAAVAHGYNNLEVSKQYSKGTKMVPNGRHGVYVHTPPPTPSTPATRNNRNRNNNINHDLWNVYYVKNFRYDHHPDNNNNNLMSYVQRPEPSYRYKIPRQAQFVPDGKGGIWALCPEPIIPDTVTRPVLVEEQSASSADTPPTSNSSRASRRQSASNDSAATPPTSNSRRRRRQNGRRYQRDKRDYRLVHYSRQERNGKIMGNILPAYCKLFLDAQSGGVYLLQPNNTATATGNGDDDDDDNDQGLQSSYYSSLWHVSVEDPSNPCLLYGGIPREAKVMGDSMGNSVFLLSPGGRLQSILTRVKVEQRQQRPPTPTTSMMMMMTTPLESSCVTTTCFSYDLDLPVDGIKDIVEAGGEGTTTTTTSMDQVFVHCRQPHPNHNNTNFIWKLCRLSRSSNGLTERDAQVVALDVECPRSSRVVSDGEGGVWIWKRPSSDDLSQAGDKTFVHASADGQEEWHSPCVFPHQTRLAAFCY